MESPLIILEGVTITPLKRVHHPKGDIYHALKCTDDSFEEFGEAYFTTIHQNDVKGWKQHKTMLMNLVVPVGVVGFHFFNERISKGAFVEVAPHNYVRVTVQPGIWMAFQGLSKDLNLILNLASTPHDPAEAINVELGAFPFSKAVNTV